MKLPPKIVCLESYWNEQLFQTFSVKGFLEAMAPLFHPPLTVAHRFVESEAGIAYYLRRPGGVMWRQKELFDAPVYYLAFHGRPAAVTPVLGQQPGRLLRGQRVHREPDQRAMHGGGRRLPGQRHELRSESVPLSHLGASDPGRLRSAARL